MMCSNQKDFHSLTLMAYSCTVIAYLFIFNTLIKCAFLDFGPDVACTKCTTIVCNKVFPVVLP